MGIYNLKEMFQPKAVAVIGASNNGGSIGHAVLNNLIKGGYEGRLYPVNPKYDEVMGLKSFPSIAKIEDSIDLAVITTPISLAPNLVDEIIDQGARTAIIISGGGKEAGEDGRRLEGKIRERAYQKGLRILGPNCVGLINTESKLNASFAADMPNPGNLAVISQSGAIGTAILDLALQENMGFSHFISVGTMLDVDFGDLIDYLGHDSIAKSILLYIESLTNIRKFISAARSVVRYKPIIALKAGRSKAGARAARSHTGALAGEDAVYDAALERAGIVRVDTIEELFDCAELLAKHKRPKGSNLAIITNAGGPGVMAADYLARHNLEPAPLKTETLAALDEILPPFWSRNNPVDILGDATPETFAKCIEICLKDRSINGLLVITAPQALTDPLILAQKLAPVITDIRIPAIACFMGGREMAPANAFLNQAGIPTYSTPEKAVRAFLDLVAYNRNIELSLEVTPKLSHQLECDCHLIEPMIAQGLKMNKPFLNEADSKAILSAYGFNITPMASASSIDQAVLKADELGYPLVMKVVSSDIPHKTDANGVQLGLRSPDDIRYAYGQIMNGARAFNPEAVVDGVLLQPYLERPDYELFMGLKQDPSFGPVILFGMGGIYVEVFQDRALGLPPLNRLLAKRLMEKTKAIKLLEGFRGRAKADLEKLEEMLMRLSQLAIDYPQIAEMDINPVIIKDGVPWAVDARILLQETSVVSPMHMVISPYPQQLEFWETDKKGHQLFVRPIKPEDAPLLVRFFHRLSPTAVYYRFFRPVKELSPDMLAKFTQIDYDREIGQVALDTIDGQEEILGVARIINHPDGQQGEFAVIVEDRCQGQGIGAMLLMNALHIAKGRGLKFVYGTVLRENTGMQKLGRKLGFKVKYNEEEEAYDLTIDLTTTELD